MAKTIEQVKEKINHNIKLVTKSLNDFRLIITNEKECLAVLECLHGLLDYIDSEDAND